MNYTPIEAPVVASAEYVKNLENRVTALESNKPGIIPSTPGGYEYRWTCDDDGTNYRLVSARPSKGVHFGNSITRHPITTFWWGTQGMAASEHSKDYVRVLESLMRTKNPSFTGTFSGNNGWETAHVGFDYSKFDAVLTTDVDLVTLVLGDNTQNLTGFENSCFEFLSYIRNRLPSATIICTDNWYYSQAKATAWKNAASRVANVKYVSIAGIRNSSTEAGMGTLVWGDDGQQHAIDNSGVATHPGDSGIEAIANRLFQSIL